MIQRSIFLPLCLALASLSMDAALAGPKGTGGQGCPPGLAKKAVPCVPPGQAKKWRIGAPLPTDVAWLRIDDWDRYGLPAPSSGNRYILIDRDVLLVAIATGIVLDYLGVF